MMKFFGLALVFTSSLVFADGGVDGGGGGVIGEEPVDTLDVEYAVKASRFDLIFLLNSLSQYHCLPEESFSDEPCSPGLAYGKLIYDGSVTMFDLIKSVVIETPSAEACRTRDGREVDGSAPGSLPNSICISSFRLSKKLSKGNLRTQTLGLIAHELSHLLGADEDLATKLQADIVKISPHLLNMSNEQQVGFAAEYAEESYEHAKEAVERKHAYKSLCLAARKVLEGFEGLDTARQAIAWPSLLFDKRTDAAFWGADGKLRFLESAACSRSIDRQDSKLHEQMMDRTFEGAKTINLPTYMRRMGIASGMFNPPGYVLRRIDSVETAQVELAELTSLLDLVSRRLNEHTALRQP